MIHPSVPGKISLNDLKRCQMTPIFFDTFFNLEKYLDHEQRDPFASQRDPDAENGEETPKVLINPSKLAPSKIDHVQFLNSYPTGTGTQRKSTSSSSPRKADPIRPTTCKPRFNQSNVSLFSSTLSGCRYSHVLKLNALGSTTRPFKMLCPRGGDSFALVSIARLAPATTNSLHHP